MIDCNWQESSLFIFSGNVDNALIYYSHLGSVALLLGLIFVSFLNLRPWPRKAFRLMLVFYILWLIFDLVLWANEKTDNIVFFWTIINLIEPPIFLFAYIYFLSFTKKKLSRNEKFGLTLLIIPTVLMAPTSLSVVGFDYTNCERNVVEGIGAYYNYFLELVFIGLIFTSAIKSNSIKILTQDMLKRSKFVAACLIFLLLSFLATNFIGTLVNDYQISQYGHLAVPLFAVFLTIASIRFEALETRVLTIDASIIALTILLFSLLFVRNEIMRYYLLLITLVLCLPLGYILHFSIRKEATLRLRNELLVNEQQRINSNLRKLIELKSAFISLATHHIASPLTVVKGYVELLRDGKYGELPREAAEKLGVMEESTDTMRVLVKDFLDVSKIDDKEIEYRFAPCDLGEIVGEAVAQMNDLTAQRGAALECTKISGLTINADKKRLTHAVRNILENCLRAGKQNTIKITLTKEKSGCKLVIADTVVRTLPVTPSKLIEKFTSTGNTSEANMIGSGLGLYVAKKIIEAHGGEMMITAKEIGTEFRIIFRKAV